MTPPDSRWQRVAELFDRVADLEPAQREQALAEACAGDPALRVEVERLLRADGMANPLDQDIAGPASALLLETDHGREEGRRFGPYRIGRLLGEGGMGRVYLATRDDQDFAQTVALKRVGGIGGLDREAARRRFVQERRILARLEHPHIARLLDGGVDDEGQPWFAMEYVDGAMLTEWCDARRLAVSARLALFAKICDAVDHAHGLLIVHRDLKPGNILVDARGEPKVLDFGIAKLLDDEDSPGVTVVAASTVLMTPDYAAPEQLRGGQITTATDVYALGAVLFELLTGRRPFRDALASREPPTASRAVTERSDALVERASACGATPRALRRSLRGDLDRVLRTALDPDPARRYRSAARLAEDLRAVVAGQPISLRGDRRYRAGKFLARHRLAVAALAIAMLGLVGTTGWALWQTRQTAARAQEAALQAQLAARESRTAVSVKNLVAGLLSSASPDVALGRQLTVKQVLDSSRDTLPASLRGEPAVAVELLTVMARSYTALEDHASAHAMLERALPLASQVNAQRRATLHTARLELAMEQSDVDAMRSAAAALRPLLPQLRDPGSRIDALLALGYFDNHEYRSNAAMAAGPLEAARQALPPWDVRRVRAASMLAGWYLGVGKQSGAAAVQKAVALLNATLADAQRYLPARHPTVTHLRQQLAHAYMGQQELARAVALLQQVRDDTLAVHGRDSVQVAIVESQLGNVEKSRGDYVQARRHAEQALRIFEGSAATDPMDRSAAKMLLAEAAEVRGDYALAQRWFEDAHADFTSGASEHARSMPFLQLRVARMMARRGERAAAAKVYAQVLAQASPGSLAQALAWNEQGELAREAGDATRALALHRQALASLQQPALASYKPYYYSVLLQLARDQQALQQHAASEATLAQLVRELDARFPMASPDLADAYLLLGRMLSPRAEQRSEARRLLDRCMEVRARVYGPRDPRTDEARRALAGR